MRDFNHSVSVLVKAYFDETLEHSFCSACAVGNLIAEAIGTKPKLHDGSRSFIFIPYDRRPFLIGRYEFKLFENGQESLWQDIFMTEMDGNGKEIQYQKPAYYTGDAKAQIDATGYTWQELAKIEYAFETAPLGNDAYSWMFNGLMDVVDVLAEIHGIDLTAKEEAKKLFVKI